MYLDVTALAEEAMKSINDKLKNMKKLNIAVVGKSGVGKSTLINSVFRENLAEVGVGRPVTQEICRIEKKEFPLTVYDTPGFEVDSDRHIRVRDGLIDIVKKSLDSKKAEDDMIHCIWYCVSGQGARFEDSEAEWIRSFTEEAQLFRVPVIIVITQSFPKAKARQLKSEIEALNLDVCKVVNVLAQDVYDGEEDEQELLCKAYGLDVLIQLMEEVLPDELIDTLQNVQKAALKQKIKRAHAVVAASTAAAMGASAVPAPVVDAAMIVPVQISMIAAITSLFGLKVSKSVITAFISSTIGTTLTTIGGRAAFGALVKLVPGGGTVAGAVMQGATAGVFTTALGEAYIQIMVAVAKGEMTEEELVSEKGKERMKELFRLKLGKKADEEEQQ